MPDIVEDILKVHDTTKVHIFLTELLFSFLFCFLYEMLNHPRIRLQLSFALIIYRRVI